VSRSAGWVAAATGGRSGDRALATGQRADALPAGPFLVLGLGRAGAAAATALAARGEHVALWTPVPTPTAAERAAELEAAGVRVAVGPWDGDLRGARTVVKSPGVPFDDPAILAARAAGTAVMDELELGRRLTARPLVPVTGTDGKSTVSTALAAALGAPLAGNAEFGVPLSALPPGDGPAVVECSSFQLEGCDGPLGEIAVLTNLSEDHLHRHGSIDAYAAAKRRLFTHCGAIVARAVVNVDGAPGQALATDLAAAGATVARVSADPGATPARVTPADYRVRTAEWDAATARVLLATPDGDVEVATRLPGPHNAVNAATVLATCDLLELPRARTLSALAAFPGVPGRWDRVDAGQPFDVVVDFAHTVAGLRAVLATARAVLASRKGRLLLVLSAGGGTDPRKRTEFGRLGAEHADVFILTEGSNRGEPLEQVLAAIAAGAGDAVRLMPRRREAMAAALAQARPGDLVLIAGRGAMPRLLIDLAGNGPLFDDRTVAREELARVGH
jgi:UDP-N-acetylmuramoylalanine-D-glutamate ligase